MSDIVIKAENLGKKYIIGHQGRGGYKTFREQMYEGVKNIFSHSKKMLTGQQVVEGNELEDFWALQNINFEIRQGEQVGIIGRNGAGKSTLLKILSRITEPTTGKVSINGRVSSLLEVGTGFHPELTGRENVFLNGAILGMKRKEIQSKFDEILDFSGVEKFLDTPLKHYSSGMQLRLAFAVAAFLEPEILIIDEVLSVGDAEFQRKCLGKMEDVSKSGRTILFVSHDLTAVNNLTQKCILIKSGKLVDFNSTAKTINKYIWESTQYTQFEKKVNNANIKPQILKCVVKTSLANNVHEQSKEISFIIDYYITEIPKNNTWLSLHITDLYDRGVIHLMTNTKLSGLADKPGLNRLTCLIPQLRLYMGKYNVSLYFSGPPNAEVYERLKDILSFEVIMDNISNEFGWKTNTCTYIEQCKWTNSNV